MTKLLTWLILTLIMAYPIQALTLSKMDKERLTQDGIYRVVASLEDVEVASTKYKIPRWILLGVLYNESNFQTRPRGLNDRGRAYGLGQIHCGPGGFSWLPLLKEELGVERCKELYNPDLNILSTAYILAHIVKWEARAARGRPTSWLNVLTTYQKGARWRKRKWTQSKPYFQRVRWYGKRLARYSWACKCTLDDS